MKTIITGVMLLVCGLVANAQAFHAEYEYDANGNRERAFVYYLSTSLKSGDLTLDKIKPQGPLSADSSALPQRGWEKGGVDPMGSFSIKVYPNPTQGMLLIEIDGASNDQLFAPGNFITIWDVRGQQVINITTLTQYNTINLSQNANGTYLLKMQVDGKVKEFKIVKN